MAKTDDATVETVETEAAKPAKGIQVSCVLSPEELDKLEDYRWANRIDKRSDVVRLALSQFLATV